MERAEEYERLYPGTGISPDLAAERMERIQVKERAARGEPRRLFLVPEMPWQREKDE